MRFLLDTHTLLWAGLDDSRLSESVRSLLLDRQNTLYLSAASALEIVIKFRLGKLHLPRAPRHFVPQCLQLFGVETLPVTLEHAMQVETLPEHHRDPFDRIVIAQAQLENLAILTRDRVFERYPVQTMW